MLQATAKCKMHDNGILFSLMRLVCISFRKNKVHYVREQNTFQTLLQCQGIKKKANEALNVKTNKL